MSADKAPAMLSVRVQPTGIVTETKVVLAGMASVKDALAAACGPLLVTVMV